MLSAAIALTAGTTSCKHSSRTAAEQAPEIDVARVKVDSVVLYKEYPGTLRARSVVELVARVDGYVQSQNYKAGDKVAKGQVLFTIEPQRYADAVSQAQAQLASARSTYAYASQQYEAMKKALESDAVSQMEVIQARSNMETAQATIKNAEAALRTAQTNLGYCTVRAPFTGTVSESGPDVGAFVGGSVSPVTLATIYDNSTLYADFYIEDASYLRMFSADNNRHMVNYDSIPVSFSEPLPHNYTAALTYMAPDVNTGTGTLQVRALLSNPYDELRDGMYATVSLPYKVDPRAMLVKDASIATDQLGKYVYVVNDSDRVVYTPIKTGNLVNDTMRVVTSGLEPGQRYVTKALLKVRSGVEVKPVLTE